MKVYTEQLVAKEQVMNNSFLTMGGLRDILKASIDTYGELSLTIFFGPDRSIECYKRGVNLDGTIGVCEDGRALCLNRSQTSGEILLSNVELLDIVERYIASTPTVTSPQGSFIVTEDTPITLGGMEGEASGNVVEVFATKDEIMFITSTQGHDWENTLEWQDFDFFVISWLVTDYLKELSYEEVTRIRFL